MSTTYKTATEAAAELRAAFKAKGWTPRMVSVRSDYYSGGSSIDVTVKDASVPFLVVKKMTKAASRVRYDEYSGEILSGGNRYANARMSDECAKAKAAPYIEAVEAAKVKLLGSESDNVLIPIVGEFLLGNGIHRSPMWLALWSDRHIVESTVNEIALRIAILTEAPEAADYGDGGKA